MMMRFRIVFHEIGDGYTEETSPYVVEVEAKTFDSALNKVSKKYPNDKFGILTYDLVPRVDETMTQENSFICPKCGGTGYINKFQQWRGGVCYSCNGYGRLRKQEAK